MTFKVDKFTRTKRRTISLTVERDGSLTVRAPLRMPQSMIEEFIQQKTDWIMRTREKLNAIVTAPARQYTDGEKFPFLGSAFDLKLVPSQRPSLQFNNGFTLGRNMQSGGRQYFVKWYKQRAFEIISERVREYSLKYGFAPKRVRISSAKTRWGSCSPDGTLNFTWRLVMAPLEVIDYVIVHELAHLRVRNHSDRFWKVVASIEPDYKRKRKWLRDNGEGLNL